MMIMVRRMDDDVIYVDEDILGSFEDVFH